MGLNQRGIFFTLAALLVVLLLASLGLVVHESRVRDAGVQAGAFADARVGAKFDNLYAGFISMEKTGSAQQIESRNLPFGYSLDRNLFVAQTLPVPAGVWDNYFDLLNAFAIFASDENYARGFDGLSVGVETVQNDAWGGDAQTLSFALDPPCMRYVLGPGRSKAALEPAVRPGCVPVTVRAYTLDIAVTSPTADYNAVFLDVTGDANADNPVLRITVDDAACANCAIPPDQKSIETRFDPSVQNVFSLFCEGSACTSADVNVWVDAGIAVSHAGTKGIDVNMGFALDADVLRFYLEDFNMTVRSIDGNTWASVP